ncbi:unnamed protein product [Schistosoma margrebowiei]|uniref:Uncharacterized protein n=1 Tax=Schistosoma margrebowiei TaxID=48269 RepID=A0A3P7ZUK7_9TREM|nr:unnamed protein product [Schistosoma margrebowiei]
MDIHDFSLHHVLHTGYGIDHQYYHHPLYHTGINKTIWGQQRLNEIHLFALLSMTWFK